MRGLVRLGVQVHRMRGSIHILCGFVLSASLALAGDGRIEIAQSSIPFSITNSGSYLLTGNVTGVPGSNGITIAASDVALDLNGFTLSGATGSLHGVAVTGGRINIAIMNGTIRGWGQHGVGGSTASNSVARKLKVFRNTLDGIVLGSGSLVSECLVADNGVDGVELSSQCLIAESASRNNGQYGIRIGDFSLVSACASRENGLSGFTAGSRSLVLDSAARDNRGHGIEVGEATLVSDCVVYNSYSNGVHATGNGVKIQRVSAFGNGGFGVDAQASSMVDDSVARLNTNGGFRTQGRSFVLRNTADQSQSGAGFVFQGSAVRVEANMARGNTTGYSAGGSNHVVILNSAYTNNVNYSVNATTNRFDLVTDPMQSTSATQRAWANFAF